jgi:protein-L-isoaspartate(D-aspartate) O-methyltransferase
MMYRQFVTANHTSTKRDYLARVTETDKAAVAELAIQYDLDYWDGNRQSGYGGYRYDGRWRKVADAMVATYGIKPNMRILDIGCGKGFLLHDFAEACPGIEIAGLDISRYAVEHAMGSVKPHLKEGTAAKLPWPDDHFDLIVSINTLHNLYINDLWSALMEIERVGRGTRYICVEAYRTEREKVNLMYWQLTCRAFHTPAEWEWIFSMTGYSGDHEYVFFE